MVLYAVNNILN